MNDLETRVLQTIGENTSSPDVFTDDATGMAQIRESLNDAIEEICMLTGSIKRKQPVALQANMNFYQLRETGDRPAWVTEVWLINQKRRLIQKDFTWLVDYNPGFLKTTATPIHYALINHDILMLHPTPSSSTDMLEVNTVIIPERYALDTDRIKLRTAFQWAAVHYAVSEYWASRGDAKSAVFAFNKYLTHLGIQEMYPEAQEKSYSYKSQKATP